MAEDLLGSITVPVKVDISSAYCNKIISLLTTMLTELRDAVHEECRIFQSVEVTLDLYIHDMQKLLLEENDVREA